MWYSVSLLYRSESDEEPAASSLWEESIILVQADDEMQAQKEVKKFICEPFSYQTVDGRQLRWVFDSIERVCEIDDLISGAELFSRFLLASEAESLKKPFSE